MVRWLHAVTAVTLVLALTSGASAAKGQGKKGKRGHGVRGTVVAVDKDSLTIKTRARKNQGGEATEKKFQLGSATQYETVKVTRVAKGEKPQRETKPATFDDLKAGQRVRVVAKGEAAEKVLIVEHAKRKKKAA